MNYHHADLVYRKYRLEDTLTDDFFKRVNAGIGVSVREMNHEGEFNWDPRDPGELWAGLIEKPVQEKSPKTVTPSAPDEHLTPEND